MLFLHFSKGTSCNNVALGLMWNCVPGRLMHKSPIFTLLLPLFLVSTTCKVTSNLSAIWRRTAAHSVFVGFCCIWMLMRSWAEAVTSWKPNLSRGKLQSWELILCKDYFHLVECQLKWHQSGLLRPPSSTLWQSTTACDWKQQATRRFCLWCDATPPGFVYNL